MVARLLAKGPRTILLDEVDRNLDPKRDGVGELVAVLNSGYRKGATRPVLVPDGANGWDVREMATYGAVVVAGISPNLPDDTASRMVTVVLLPDDDGLAEHSDWEQLDKELAESKLPERLAAWARDVADDLAKADPVLPEGCVGRKREIWRPLARVAHVAGGRWPDAVTRLIERDLAEHAHDKEMGLMSERPTVALLRDIHDGWQPRLDWAPVWTTRAAEPLWPGTGSLDNRAHDGVLGLQASGPMGRGFPVRAQAQPAATRADARTGRAGALGPMADARRGAGSRLHPSILRAGLATASDRAGSVSWAGSAGYRGGPGARTGFGPRPLSSNRPDRPQRPDRHFTDRRDRRSRRGHGGSAKRAGGNRHHHRKRGQSITDEMTQTERDDWFSPWRCERRREADEAVSDAADALIYWLDDDERAENPNRTVGESEFMTALVALAAAVHHRDDVIYDDQLANGWIEPQEQEQETTP